MTMNEKTFDENINRIEKAIFEKDREITRLMAANLELQLKVQNLTYFISTITTRRPSEKPSVKTGL
jgi:hypothetical protein